MNIAEGSAKRGAKEFRRYLDIALGSTAELSYCLLLSKDLGYVEEPSTPDSRSFAMKPAS